ncbi:ATP-grasp domain-containing protein, partial [Staphylococcus pseudintermedius]
YKGVSGFDLLVDKNHDVYAIDLNFRQNGSTSMLLLKDRLHEGFHKFLSYHSTGDNTHFINTIEQFIKNGHLYPLAYYDGDYFGKDNVKSRFVGIWHAETEEKALEQEQLFLDALSSQIE